MDVVDKHVLSCYTTGIGEIMDYVYPSWLKTNANDRLKWTDEDWVKAKAEHLECEEKNRAEYRARLAVKKEMMDMASLAYGNNSLVEKYLKKNDPPRWTSYIFDGAYDAWKKAKEEEAKKVKDMETSRAMETLTAEAILYLQSHGKVLGTDFTIGTALNEANHIAFDLAIKDKVKEGVLHSFSGEDNCENCGGWDGVSRRCECGNRRVSWTQGWGFSFKNPDLEAEAY